MHRDPRYYDDPTCSVPNAGSKAWRTGCLRALISLLETAAPLHRQDLAMLEAAIGLELSRNAFSSALSRAIRSFQSR